MEIIKYKNSFGEDMILLLDEENDRAESMSAEQYAQRLEAEANKENGTLS